ncbi:CAMK family protein kinase [Tritrichomonas foetus]|uniref:CAMK family protein kinase n=1 Tax=Tritrichomonas foetus TaxID=1144522 RepID=A0A1J4J6S7_9EUKA|nr:CAMK family protein kinase [Tritrichomonas foetus]|eukprot:OHS93363.1 CAMK family protein kinase [Tritrichomonas foetus]
MNEIGDYILLNPIGQGTFACVRLAEHKIIHTQVAVKIIPRTNFEDPDHVARFQREVDLIKDLDHPFIAEFFEVLEDDTNFYIVMEYVENDNMLNYVNINGELQEDVARHYFCQLISVLEYLHVEKQISHRDLKAENVLLDRYKNIRLIDFGLSNTFSKENQFLKTACGSPGMFQRIFGRPNIISNFSIFQNF